MLHEQIHEVGRTAWNIAVGPDHGPPLLFFHGVTRRWQSFLPVLPSLMLRHHCRSSDGVQACFRTAGMSKPAMSRSDLTTRSRGETKDVPQKTRE